MKKINKRASQKLIKDHVWAAGNWNSIGPNVSTCVFLTQKEYDKMTDEDVVPIFNYRKSEFRHKSEWDNLWDGFYHRELERQVFLHLSKQKK